jgi:hypothetical protein
MNKAIQAGYPVESIQMQPGVKNLLSDTRFKDLIAKQQ